MKNKILFLLLLLLIPFVVNAEKCTVINGTGKNIGDEIACDTEHFYVIENDGENIKMLAKYNLYVGANYNKINIDINKTYIRYECNSSYYCNTNPTYFYNNEQVSNYDEWVNKILSEYNLEFIRELYWFDEGDISTGNGALYSNIYGEMYNIDDKTYLNKTYKLYPYTTITKNTEGYVLQNEIARGVTGEKGKANYPINSTLAIFYQNYDEGVWYWPISYYLDDYENFEEGYTDFELKEEINTKQYLNDYKNYLIDEGFNIKNIDMISIRDINSIVLSVTGDNLPLEEWYYGTLRRKQKDSDEEPEVDYLIAGDLKEYLSNDYSWLWNTSYWTKTLATNEIKPGYIAPEYMVYFVSSAGDICLSKSDCWSGIPRAGLRPVVTISTSDINYQINTKTDGNGTVLAEKIKATEGEVIKFTIEPKPGYVLSEVKVIDANGNVLTFTNNTFTMPNANVVIEATFVPKNPKTGDIAIYTICLFAIASGIIFISQKRKFTFLK